MQTDILIIGGGLAGLSLAKQLTDQDRDFLLVEARDRLGGRILTQHQGDGYFDLGPAWFWPGQPRMAAMVKSLGLSRFDQHYQGDLLFEDEQGRVQRGRGYASMQGSYRMEGGFGAIITALSAQIPASRIRLSKPINELTRDSDGITARTSSGQTITARRVVLALPPRIAAQVKFTPDLPVNTRQTTDAIPTWMAGQAKALAVYHHPFWREAGLSGDAMSRHGPLAEIHDASPARGGPFALFGFIGAPPSARTDEQNLRSHVLAQLARIFGPQAAEPSDLLIKDWAFDPYTANESDRQPLNLHPQYGLPNALRELWGDDLVFCCTEVAARNGGFLEGALEAAESAVSLLARERA